jgi:transposase
MKKERPNFSPSTAPLRWEQTCNNPTTVMITLFIKDCNHQITQEYYDRVIHSISIHQLRCSCGHSGCMIIHGYYRRHLKTSNGIIQLQITRVRCTDCGATHALLLSSIVPYSQIALSVQIKIIQAFHSGSDRNAFCTLDDTIDENHVKSILLRYQRHWLERIRAVSTMAKPVNELICICFSHYARQFMQIHRTFNTLFTGTT